MFWDEQGMWERESDLQNLTKLTQTLVTCCYAFEMNGPQIKEEFAENVCSKPLEEINKEVKEEHIAEEMVINMEEHDAIKVFVSSSSVRKENVDLMSEVFKVLLSLEARCGVEVDSAKKEAEHLRERIKAKEIDLQNVNNSIQSISETARKLQSQSNASQIEPSKQDSVLGSTEPADIKMRTFPSRELREKVKFLKETFQKLKLKIEQPQKEKFQNEKILILSAKLQEIENSLQSVSGPWQEKKLMNAIIRTLRKVKKLQSQSNASQSEPMKQDSGLASAEPADKKMRKLQDQKPTKSFAPPQQLEEKGELVAQPLPNIMLSSNLDTTRIKLPSNEKIAQSEANKPSSKTRPGDNAGRREGRSGAGSKDQKGERSGEKAKPSEPFKMNMPKNKIKMTLATAKTTAKPNSAVLEKLGMTTEEQAEARRAAKRKQELEKVEMAAAAKRAKQADAGGKQADGGTYLIETLKERLKNKVEAGKAKAASAAASEKVKAKSEAAVPGPVSAPATESPVKAKKVKSKEGPDSKGRREELLKQLKAVEDAIHRKRTKLDGWKYLLP